MVYNLLSVRMRRSGIYYLRFSASNLRVSSSKSGIWSVLGGGGGVEDLDPALPGTLLGGAGKSQLDSEKSPSSSYSHKKQSISLYEPSSSISS